MAEKTQAEIDAEKLEQERLALAAAASALRDYLTTPAEKEKLYEAVGSPRVLVRVFNRQLARERYFCTVQIAGTAPYRYTTAEERQAGILSLNPPSVSASSIEKLIESGSLALQSAIFATPGVGHDENVTGTFKPLIGPSELAMVHYRTARAIRAALRQIDEDI
jgi:hypothetical protein